MTYLSSTLLLLAVFLLETKAELGLYTRRSHQLFTDGLAAPCPAGCEEGNGCVSSSGSNFWIDSHCYSMRSGRSKMFTEFGTNNICHATYSDSECGESIDPDIPCSYTEAGTCDDSTRKHDYYSNFCIASSQPSGEFTVPMASLTIYGSKEDCNSNVGGSEFTIPADPGLCLVEPAVDVNFNRTQGGTRAYCDGSGMLVFDFYTDSGCTEQNEDTQMMLFSTRGTDCQLEPDDKSYSRVSCDIQYYCRDLSQTPAATKIASAVVIPQQVRNSGATKLGYYTLLLSSLVFLF